MAATVSQHYQALGGGATTLAQMSVVVGSGEGLLVLVLDSDAASGSATAINGVDWNGAALTNFGTTLTGNDGVGAAHRQSCWYLASPTPGTHTVTATFASAPLIYAMEVIVVAGHDTGTMVRGWDGSGVTSGLSTGPSISLTTVSGDLVIDFPRVRSDAGDPRTTSPTSGQTKLDATESGVAGTWFWMSSSKTATTTSTTMSWPVTATGDTWATQVAAIIPSGGSPVSVALGGSAGTGGTGTASPVFSIGL